METKKLFIRTATPEDAAELLAIYAPYVEHTAITFEYTVPTLEEFAGRIRRTLEKYPYLAAEREGRLVGYAYASVFHGRAAYGRSVETSIYVAQHCKGQGIGGTLYRALEETLSRQHILNLNAAIATPWQQEDEYLSRDSAAFHRHMGYQLVGEFHQVGYKFGRWYDMMWMEKFIGEHTDRPEAVIPFSQL